MTEDLYANIEIAPRDVEKMLRSGTDFLLVDVREKWEHDLSRIENAKLIPLREVPANLAQFEQASEIVVFCHHGMRSLNAAAWLRSQGVEGAKSMAGGIDRWAQEIDSKVARY